jgi:hypothetical protein
VSCEQCHGAAEGLARAAQGDRLARSGGAVRRKGFYDNNDFRLRAEKCATCHVEIDHEIVAAATRLCQFEMVAYAQVMKHWDDREEHPGFTPIRPVGDRPDRRPAACRRRHRRARAAVANYQSLGESSRTSRIRTAISATTSWWKDAARQAQGISRWWAS